MQLISLLVEDLLAYQRRTLLHEIGWLVDGWLEQGNEIFGSLQCS
jgi:hypothetical protein